MNNSNSKNNLDTKNKAPKFLINLYGILAVIFVLIPEWIAEFGITFDNDYFKNNIPKYKSNYSEINYLYISTLTIKELRLLASKLKILGYSNENKKFIKRRILRVIKNQKRIEFIKESLRWKNLC